MDRTKKTLITLLVIGALATIGAGTYATFTAQTSNSGNSFATGTLVLSNAVTSGSTCYSTDNNTATGATDTNTGAAGGCSAVISVSAKGPGDGSSNTLTITNTGTLGAKTFTVASAGCTASDATTSGVNNHGTGDPCTVLDIYIQQYSDSGFTTPSACVYGGGTATTCAFSASDTVATLGTTPISIGTLAAGSSAYFKVAVQLDSGAGNNMQGRAATWTLNWNVSY